MKLRKTKAGLVFATILLSTIGMGVGQASASQFHDPNPAESQSVCYVGTHTKKPKTRAGITAATMRMENYWCVQDGEVTKSLLLDHYAETSTPFNRIVHLPENTGGASIVDNEAVAWKQFVIMFEIQTGFISFTKPADFCVRSFGKASGTIEGDSTCGAY